MQATRRRVPSIVIFLSQPEVPDLWYGQHCLWHSNRMTLDAVQTRVLGTLIEKEIVTPENYPRRAFVRWSPRYRVSPDRAKSAMRTCSPGLSSKTEAYRNQQLPGFHGPRTSSLQPVLRSWSSTWNPCSR